MWWSLVSGIYANSLVVLLWNVVVVLSQEMLLPLRSLFLGNQWNDIRVCEGEGATGGINGRREEAVGGSLFILPLQHLQPPFLYNHRLAQISPCVFCSPTLVCLDTWWQTPVREVCVRRLYGKAACWSRPLFDTKLGDVASSLTSLTQNPEGRRGKEGRKRTKNGIVWKGSGQAFH